MKIWVQEEIEAKGIYVVKGDVSGEDNYYLCAYEISTGRPYYWTGAAWSRKYVDSRTYSTLSSALVNARNIKNVCKVYLSIDIVNKIIAHLTEYPGI